MRRLFGLLLSTAIILTVSACDDVAVGNPDGTYARAGFPHAGNTGPSYAGLNEATLPACAGSTANWTISTTRTIQNCKFTGTKINVTAPNVRLKNMVILGNAPYIVQSHSTGLVIENSVVGPKPGASPTGPQGQPCSASVGDAGFTLLRTEILGCADGVKARGNVRLTNSYFHDLARTCADGCTHNDSVQFNENATLTSLIVVGNAMYGDPCTSNRHFQLKNARNARFDIRSNFFYGMHGITNIDGTASGNSGQISSNTYAGSANRGPFTSKADNSGMSPGLYTGGGMVGITKSDNRFEDGSLVPTNGVAKPYTCVRG
jgi:hypothetical protein